MNQFKIVRYPAEVNSTKVLMHIQCEDELKVLVEDSGKKTKFKAAFEARIRILIENGSKAVEHRTWFESLKNNQGLYSIKFISIDNIRILFTFHRNIAYLLYSFKETSKGQDPKSYRYGIKMAYERINDIEEG